MALADYRNLVTANYQRIGVAQGHGRCFGTGQPQSHFGGRFAGTGRLIDIRRMTFEIKPQAG
jgi:hypothetical protein